jgi:hypothetical protein
MQTSNLETSSWDWLEKAKLERRYSFDDIRIDRFKTNEMEHLNYLTEDGYILCPLCDGKKVSPRCKELIEEHGESVDDIYACGFGYCECCNGKGKIDWVSWLMGTRFNLDLFNIDMATWKNVEWLQNFLAYKKLFGPDMLTDHWAFDDDAEAQRAAFEETIGMSNIATRLGQMNELYRDILIDEDYGVSSNVSGDFLDFVRQSIVYSVVGTICSKLSENFDEFKIVPTSDVEDARDLLKYYGSGIDSKISVSGMLELLIHELDPYGHGILYDEYDSLLEALKKTETSERKIYTPKQLEDLGLLLC